MNEIEYKLEQLRTEPILLPPHFINSKQFLDSASPFYDGLRTSLETYIATRIKGEKDFIFYPQRQSFIDYILRRNPKPYKIKIIAKDMLKNPPSTEHSVIKIYEINEIPTKR